jgi:pimeloyl-ACP methyl ester carboxylesterase
MPARFESKMIDGIERISCYPETQKYETPIVFQHGAWHGAWCWEEWQKLFAEWGWVSHAHSLSGHGKSEKKRPVRLNTLGFYRDTLKTMVDLCEKPPVVIGHSMGGMITQWYLAGVGDLPAAVLLASMPLYDYPWNYLILDPVSMLLATLTFHGYPFVRSPQHVKRLFLSDGAIVSPEALHARMDDESLLVTLQLNPLLWHPRKNPKTPMLVMAAEKDTLFTVKVEENLAKFYGADFYMIKDTAHNAMIERSYQESAKYVHNWLVAKGIK